MQPVAVARYRILSQLGAGGMGRRVAIKVLPAPSAADETARTRLVREAQAAAKIDHPNVCAIYEVGSHEGRDYFVMQYVEGRTLADRLSEGTISLLLRP